MPSRVIDSTFLEIILDFIIYDIIVLDNDIFVLLAKESAA